MSDHPGSVGVLATWHGLRRAAAWLYAANEAQYELWRRWCGRQRPWEDQWLH